MTRSVNRLFFPIQLFLCIFLSHFPVGAGCRIVCHWPQVKISYWADDSSQRYNPTFKWRSWSKRKGQLESSRRVESLKLKAMSWITKKKKKITIAQTISRTMKNLSIDKCKEPSRTWGLVGSCGKWDWLLSQPSARPVRQLDWLSQTNSSSNGRLTTFLKHLILLEHRAARGKSHHWLFFFLLCFVLFLFFI